MHTREAVSEVTSEDMVNMDWNSLSGFLLAELSRRQNNVSKSGFLGGCFYSFGLLSVFKQIKVRLMKCFGPGLEFKIHKGPECTLIKKIILTLLDQGSEEARCIPASPPET